MGRVISVEGIHMNINLGITPQTQAQQDLYRLAYQCAHSHITVKCNICTTCTYNVHRYGYDPNEAELIKARALMDYNQYIATQALKKKAYWKVELAIGAVALVLILFIIFGIPQIIGAETNATTYPTTIEEATALVRQLIRDVNYDRQINCIDYAVVFYEIWPDSKIIRVWDDADLNHLLNMVGDRYIEPQVRNGDPHILWPTFDTAYKKDQTNTWGYHWADKRRW
jgi:hypothetical protein